MAEFSPEVVALPVSRLQASCCVCLRWCGHRMHIHHIVPKAENGAGTYENGIPVCLDCHAEIESRSNSEYDITIISFGSRSIGGG
jgi:5-methylcytosine-specific restriction endonuclease McrA